MKFQTVSLRFQNIGLTQAVQSLTSQTWLTRAFLKRKKTSQKHIIQAQHNSALCEHIWPYNSSIFFPSAIVSKQTFKLRMVSHKIKQINAPLRFKNVVLVFLIKVINISSEQKKLMYLYRQNYTIINQNWQNHIPLNGRSWNDLKRSLDGSLKKQYF